MKNDGGPAFPGVEYTYYDGVPQVGADYQGMTLRQYYAGQAVHYMPHNAFEFESNAEWCVKMADALIAKLEKE